MKSILLTGKFTDFYKEIGKELREKFEVKTCVDKLSMIQGMLKLNKPDALLIILEEIDNEMDKILSEKYEDTLVICIGKNPEKETEYKAMIGGRFAFLSGTRGVVNLVLNVCEIIEKGFKVQSIDDIIEAINATDDTDTEGEISEDGAKAGDKKSILIVDDSGLYLRTIKGMIGEEKYEIRMATSGYKAIAMIDEKKPDLILLDYEMPICDGRHTMKIIRESEKNKDIPIVFVTAVNKRDNITRVLEMQPEAYLLKPVDKERLLRTIEEIIG